MNLIECVAQVMGEDEEHSDKQSDYLTELYRNSHYQQEIDSVFICLCGYSLKSLIEMVE
ncbi:MAG: hypothetical protein J0I93_01970 [Legionella sp.]|nr:hypothetical protein [Legionella sp.]